MRSMHRAHVAWRCCVRQANLNKADELIEHGSQLLCYHASTASGAAMPTTRRLRVVAAAHAAAAAAAAAAADARAAPPPPASSSSPFHAPSPSKKQQQQHLELDYISSIIGQQHTAWHSGGSERSFGWCAGRAGRSRPLIIPSAVPPTAATSLLQHRRAFLAGLTDAPAGRVYRERKLLGWAPDQLYDVVARVEDYAQFVPWCVGSTVLSARPDGGYLEAELKVGFQALSERYTSQVTLERPARVHSSVRDSRLFGHLESTWLLRPGPAPGTTWLSFSVDFAFRSALHAHVADAFFSEVATRMVGAFEARCAALYGPSALGGRGAAGHKGAAAVRAAGATQQQQQQQQHESRWQHVQQQQQQQQPPAPLQGSGDAFLAPRQHAPAPQPPALENAQVDRE